MPLSRFTSTALDPRKARIALIEDDVLLGDLLCLGLRTRIQPADLRLFVTGREGLAYCRSEKPELVMIDLGLPDMDGREVIRALQALSPDTRVIVLTGQVNPTLPGQLLALGVSGYIDKASSFENAEDAVKRVLGGGIFFSAGVRPVAAVASPATGTRAEGDIPPEALTEREREIARLVAGGMISKEIAERLQLSPRTVEKARAQLLDKLQVRDLPALVRWCVKHGLT